MKTLLRTLVTVVFLTATAPALADPAAGIAAFERKDYATAYRELRPLAEAGEVEAQWRVGFMLHSGYGVAEDIPEAALWYRRAAEQGHPRAPYLLGLMYFYGRLGGRDKAEAARWFRMAAERGWVAAQNELGNMYEFGWGVPRDDAEANRWYGLAVAAFRAGAARGDPGSQFDLAAMYHTGRGVPRDMRLASRLYHLAAQANVDAAQMVLGGWYYPWAPWAVHDPKVPQPSPDLIAPDIVESYKWYALAARNGYYSADEQLDFVVRHMTPAQLAEGRRRVEAWQPRQ